MRKLFKKSLACVLAVALCLTAMVGVLTVSAADALDGTIEIADVTIEAGSTTATIPVTFAVTGDEADLINVAYLNYEVDGATVDSIYDNVGPVNFNADMFEIYFNDNGEGGEKSVTVNFDVKDFAESFTVKVYDNTSATNTEKLINFGEAEKTFTVEEPKCTHEGTVITENETVTLAATCEVPGSKVVTKTCECGEVVSTETVEIPVLGHKWDDGVETTAPDCDDAGVRTYTCLNDGTHTKTEPIDALGHDMKPVDAVPATCTTPGTEAGEKCSRCDATTGLAPIPALGHNYGDNLEFCANGCGTANPDYVPAECAHVKGAGEYVANETTGNYDAVVKCTECGEEIYRVVTDIPSTTTVNTAITQDTYVNISTSVGLCTITTNSQLKNYASYSIRYARKGTDASYNIADAFAEGTDFTKYGSSKKYRIFSDIGLYQMNLPVSVMICGYDANGALIAVSTPYVTTITDEMWKLYTNPNATQVNKTAYVDLINMGSDAQAYFVKQGNAIAANNGKCGLADIADPKTSYDFLQSDATAEVPEYDLSTMPNSPVAPNNKVTVGGKSCTLTTTVNLGSGAPAVSYMISNGSKVTDKSLWSMEISYTDAYGKPATANVTGAKMLTSGSYAYFNYAPALYDTNKTITNVIKYDGNVIYTSEYSVETYIAATLPNITSDVEFTNILNSIAKFGESIRANFDVE